jgi:hypothetical protein
LRGLTANLLLQLLHQLRIFSQKHAGGFPPLSQPDLAGPQPTALALHHADGLANIQEAAGARNALIK